jgi:hypothetical protein
MEIGAFAEYMFVTNTTNRLIQINLEGIENNKDLFLCFIDLFCKGLVLCYGMGSKSIDFDCLTLDRFDSMKQKMKNAGIVVNLDVRENDTFMNTAINSEEIDRSPEDLPIESYKFVINSGYKTYNIWFRLSH